MRRKTYYKNKSHWLFPLFALFLLIATVFLSVNQAQNQQDQRSSAQISAINCSPSASDLSISSSEQQMLTLVNNFRQENNVGPLKMGPDSALQKSASWMSNDMNSSNKRDHTDSLGRNISKRFSDCEYTLPTLGENIYSGSTSPTSAFNWWKNSADHRANMLKPAYTQIGIAVDGSYWTQAFGTDVPATSTSSPTPLVSPTLILTTTPTTGASVTPSTQSGLKTFTSTDDSFSFDYAGRLTESPSGPYGVLIPSNSQDNIEYQNLFADTSTHTNNPNLQIENVDTGVRYDGLNLIIFSNATNLTLTAWTDKYKDIISSAYSHYTKKTYNPSVTLVEPKDSLVFAYLRGYDNFPVNWYITKLPNKKILVLNKMEKGSGSFTTDFDNILKSFKNSGSTSTTPTITPGGPTSSITPTDGPTPTPGISPTPTPSLAPNQPPTKLLVSVSYAGIGPGKNTGPRNLTREIIAEIYNLDNKFVTEGKGFLKYDSKGFFKGLINVGPLPNSTYYVKVYGLYTLVALVEPQFQKLDYKIINNLPNALLTQGDYDLNNVLDINDYNIALFCFQDKKCPAKDAIDINDDGKSDVVDYNLFIGNFKEYQGD